MSKLINERILVYQDQHTSAITAFIWRKRLYRVSQVLSWWREPAKWWDRQAIWLFIRVNAGVLSIGTYELCKRGDNWLLHRVLD